MKSFINIMSYIFFLGGVIFFIGAREAPSTTEILLLLILCILCLGFGSLIFAILHARKQKSEVE